MNLSYMFQEFITQIMDDGLLSEVQQEEKIIQVFDLFRFIRIYKQPLTVNDYRDTINIVDENGVQKGIYFCDLLCNTRYSFDRLLYMPSELISLRKILKIKELWFVIIEESFYAGDLKASKEFIKNNKVANLYDKIFYFNSSQSTIKILK
ncbi:hypothetical protein [Pedobacter psychroterrae]|uniref:Uncharacterized protein n=1 Tax=Pedobacter psychroterrae TaxID=2530453 RepID=A0A4R0NDJ6_9SPHI|nr:hypothetical protein [Pedobacter psychroterrae]TCC98268.1 hypothetical protein EZ437_18940 [Pedobacter psychroterrae]